MPDLRVNGEAIDPGLVDETFHRIKSEVEAHAGVSCCERDEEFRQRAIDEVVESVLLAQEAERTVETPAAGEVRAALESMLQQWRGHGASWELLETRRHEMHEEIVARLRMERFAAQVWKSLPEPDPATLRSWLGEHPERFRRRARARARHLVRFPGEDAGKEYRLLLSIRERALDGADFAQLAEQHTAREDGQTDLGWIEHERVLNAFESMLFSLREGEVSPVFFYEQSLHLIQVEAMEPEHVPAFENIEPEVRQTYLAEQKREAMHRLANDLRKRATIEKA